MKTYQPLRDEQLVRIINTLLDLAQRSKDESRVQSIMENVRRLQAVRALRWSQARAGDRTREDHC